MRIRHALVLASLCLLFAGCKSSTAPKAGDAPASADDWKPVGEAMGKAGDLAPDGSYKVTLMRSDVQVKSASGMPVPASMGLNSYAAFAGTPEEAWVVGDTCMQWHEVNPVIDRLRAGGIEVVAIHNHLLGGGPQLFFMHFQGHGKALALAATIKGAFAVLGTPAPKDAPPALSGAKEPDWKSLAAALRLPPGTPKDGVCKWTLPRTDLTVTLDGRRLPPGVGLACWAAFYACPCGKTMVMGDTCVTREELQAAIDALRKGGIAITSIHNHMLGERDEVMFMHVESEGDAQALAQAIRAAWDTLAVSKSK